jgi:hypothetical protein
MASLTYSSEALDTLPRFHRKKYVIYVEGQDDILFWGILLRKFGFTSFQLKEAGGSNEIEKYIGSIVNNDAGIIVARDCDYTDLLNNQYDHPRIIYTYGYSIENSLYCAENISGLIATYARTLRVYKREADTWLTEFAENNLELLELDLANEIYSRGIQIMGNNCSRFLHSNSSCLIAETKIKSFIKTKKKSFTKNEILDAKERIRKSPKKVFYIMRGHFLTFAIINFIKSKVLSERGKNVSFSSEHLFAGVIDNFETKCIKNQDITFIKKQINKLVSSMTT